MILHTWVFYTWNKGKCLCVAAGFLPEVIFVWLSHFSDFFCLVWGWSSAIPANFWSHGHGHCHDKCYGHGHVIFILATSKQRKKNEQLIPTLHPASKRHNDHFLSVFVEFRGCQHRERTHNADSVLEFLKTHQHVWEDWKPLCFLFVSFYHPLFSFLMPY
jgi:hypothetical protein